MKSRNFTGAVLLIVGIIIGIALTVISLHSTDRIKSAPVDEQHRLVAENKQEAAGERMPPGAASAQGPTAEEATQAPADWLKPEDMARQEAAKNGEQNPKYQSSHTTYYVYGDPGHAAATHHGTGAPAVMPVELTSTVSGYPIPVGSGPRAVDYPIAAAGNWTLGDNGLVQNPCVDPPSARGRYRPRH